MSVEAQLKEHIRNVPDFPKEGINFKDVTPIFLNPALCVAAAKELVKAQTEKIDAVVGIESRGFLLGMLIAQELNVPFVLIRKSGKLPAETIAHDYELEYGTATVEVHIDQIQKGWNVLVHDDLLATGGTAVAAAELIKKQKAKVAGFAFIVELDFLEGSKKLSQYSENILSLVHY